MTKPKIISEKVLYQSNLSKVISAKVKLPDGKIVEWDYFGNEDVVAILPIDKEGNIYLVSEWRPAWRKEIMQIPAGHCSSKTEVGRIKQVHNELREEAGIDAKKIRKLVSYAPSARMNYKVYLYLAEDLFPSYKDPDEDELIEVVKMPYKIAYKTFVEENQLTTSSTILALVMSRDKIFSTKQNEILLR